jgi:glycolate oxidase FAD binding subunit
MDTERAQVSAAAKSLSAACENVLDGTPADAVGQIVPAFVASPASTQEAAAVLRAAAAHGLAVVPRGAGTGLAWGAAPSRCDLVVDLREMNQVLEHASGDLVAQVQAGATIGHLASVLAQAGQELVIDAPAQATVGGVIATGTAGPRRLRYGAPRDLLIGVTAVRADGVVAHSGGKVVKNVAGYDLGKLLTGSRGTIALITEATFRLHPRPAAVAYVTGEFPAAQAGRAGAVAAVASAAGSALVPSAVELDWPGGAADPPRPLRVGVLLEGTESGVAERAKQMSELLGQASGSPAVATADSPPARWGQLPAQGTVVRVSFWVSALGDVLEAVGVAATRAGTRAAVTGSAGAGVLYACLDPAAGPGEAGRFAAALRERLAPLNARGPRTAVVVLTGPPEVLAGAAAYGPVPGAALMGAVKDQFDPDHRMFPGRLAAG